MEITKDNFSKLTKEEVKKLVEEGDVKEIVLPALEKEGTTTLKKAVFYLKKPTRAVIKFALSKQITPGGGIDLYAPGEVVLNSCFIGGDDVMTNDKYVFRAYRECLAYLNEYVGF